MKKSGNFGSFIAGILVTVSILTLAVPALAAGSSQTLKDVLVGGIRIVVDGEEISPTDANGNPVAPMIYNGTTYLPVRAVASALGKAVYWDGPSYTVYLGDMDGQLEYPTIMLKDMTSIYSKPKTWKTLTDNYGNTYSSAFYNASDVHHGNVIPIYEYLLGMEYSKFKCTLFVPQGNTSNRSVTVTITTDGHTVYTSPQMDRTSAPVEVEVDVTGCNDFQITFSEKNGWGDDNSPTVCLGDAGFYQ